MSRLNAEKLQELWVDGISLEDARWAFSDKAISDRIPQAVKEGYREMQETGFTDSYYDALSFECYSASEFPIYTQQVEAELQLMLENIFENIRSGRLIGLGFDNPKKSNVADIIPAHMWPPQSFDLENSSIANYGVDFHVVRVIDPEEYGDLFRKGELIIPTIKKKQTAGAKNKQGKVEHAIQHLQEQKKLDFSLSLEQQREVVLAAARHLYPPKDCLRGFSKESIRKVLKKVEKEIDSTIKSNQK